MKKMKKFLAMFLAMAMVLGMSMTTFAAEWSSQGQITGKDGAPSPADQAEAEVSNIVGTATVKAYRIYEPVYKYEGEGAEKKSLGFTGYQPVAALSGTDMPLNNVGTEGIDADKIAAIANLDENVLNGLDFVVMKSANPASEELQSFKANLGAGYWMVLVTGNVGDRIYNPMLVGVSYIKDDESGGTNLDGGILDATSNWELNATDGFAKSSEPSVSKKIVSLADPNASYDPSANGVTDEKNGAAAAIGSKVDFKVDATIPSYSKDYAEVVVSLTDTLQQGLELDQDSVQVWVGNNKVDESDGTFKITKSPAGFTIDFVSSYVLNNGNKAVSVVYKATVKDTAGLNFVANENKVTFKYTNNPSVADDTKEVDDKTYTYTFALDTELFGEKSETWNKITEEILKTGEKHTETINGVETETVRLSGATFKLTKEGETEGMEVTSDEYGRLAFKGLTEGSYTLEETKAPDGYSLNTTKLSVVIAADYNEDGTLNYYTVTVDGNTSKYTAEYNEDGEVVKIDTGHKQTIEGDTSVESTNVSNTTGFVNTKLSALPSTGGIGTTIFTVGGCAIMIIAAGLYFATRRKAAK